LTPKTFTLKQDLVMTDNSKLRDRLKEGAIVHGERDMLITKEWDNINQEYRTVKSNE
jgi:hypothetical protein